MDRLRITIMTVVGIQTDGHLEVRDVRDERCERVRDVRDAALGEITGWTN